MRMCEAKASTKKTNLIRWLWILISCCLKLADLPDRTKQTKTVRIQQNWIQLHKQLSGWNGYYRPSHSLRQGYRFSKSSQELFSKAD